MRVRAHASACRVGSSRVKHLSVLVRESIFMKTKQNWRQEVHAAVHIALKNDLFMNTCFSCNSHMYTRTPILINQSNTPIIQLEHPATGHDPHLST